MSQTYDYIIVGGGLQGGLLSLAINHYQPQAAVLLIEQTDSVGGNHTWSFHESDIPRGAKQWIAPLITSRWPGYSVRFPRYKRHVAMPYSSIDSRNFDREVKRLFDTKHNESQFRSTPTVSEFGSSVCTVNKSANLQLGSTTLMSADNRVTSSLRLNANASLLDGGTVWIGETAITGNAVIDCRGPAYAELHSLSRCGYQKFHGFEIELAEPWPESNPILMDSGLSQVDGFRFIYTLPFASHRVLIEHTQFSDSSEFDRAECLEKVSRYISRHTSCDWQVVREESGCLPMPWGSSLMPDATIPLKGGYSGGWFHAATGYSLPLAVRWADTVAKTPTTHVAKALQRLAADNRWQAKQSRFLNRLLFQLVKPERRFEIFQRFYRALSNESIARFYAHQFTVRDLVQILIGRPPSRLTPVRFIGSFFRER